MVSTSGTLGERRTPRDETLGQSLANANWTYSKQYSSVNSTDREMWKGTEWLNAYDELEQTQDGKGFFPFLKAHLDPYEPSNHAQITLTGLLEAQYLMITVPEISQVVVISNQVLNGYFTNMMRNRIVNEAAQANGFTADSRYARAYVEEVNTKVLGYIIYRACTGGIDSIRNLNDLAVFAEENDLPLELGGLFAGAYELLNRDKIAELIHGGFLTPENVDLFQEKVLDWLYQISSRRIINRESTKGIGGVDIVITAPFPVLNRKDFSVSPELLPSMFEVYLMFLLKLPELIQSGMKMDHRRVYEDLQIFKSFVASQIKNAQSESEISGSATEFFVAVDDILVWYRDNPGLITKTGIKQNLEIRSSSVSHVVDLMQKMRDDGGSASTRVHQAIELYHRARRGDI